MYLTALPCIGWQGIRSSRDGLVTAAVVATEGLAGRTGQRCVDDSTPRTVALATVFMDREERSALNESHKEFNIYRYKYVLAFL